MKFSEALDQLHAYHKQFTFDALRKYPGNSIAVDILTNERAHYCHQDGTEYTAFEYLAACAEDCTRADVRRHPWGAGQKRAFIVLVDRVINAITDSPEPEAGIIFDVNEQREGFAGINLVAYARGEYRYEISDTDADTETPRYFVEIYWQGDLSPSPWRLFTLDQAKQFAIDHNRLIMGD